jgi:3-dehydroquinate synthase
VRKIDVQLIGRQYEICISENLLQEGGLFKSAIQGPSALIVSNDVVAPLYLDTLQKTLERVGIRSTSVCLPDGEANKGIMALTQIYDAMLDARCDRSTTVIALGGGVVGDMAGFAAATYQRGVPYVQVPTTLLSQVDSSVGGKTAINHPRGKNMIGAFWQPRLVVSDTSTLRTLADREFSAGLAEVIKYGLIRDVEFLTWLETNMSLLMARDPAALAYAIERSCQNKAEVVAADELETAKEGGRALLNLGHTFGHAIETGAGYGEWLHGEAVAAGMVIAAHVSMQLGWLNQADIERVKNILVAANLPVKPLEMPTQRYLDLMSHDKKVQAGRMRYVLLQKLGQAVTYDQASEFQICSAIEAAGA